MTPRSLVEGGSAVFDLLLRNSVQASALILMVLGLRAALAGRMSGRWLHGLWLVVLLRLALPWVPESEWSPFGLLPRVDSPISPLRSTVPGESASPGRADSESAYWADSSLVGHEMLPRLNRPALNVPAGEAPTGPSGLLRALYAAWLGGALVLGTYVLIAIRRLSRAVCAVRPVTDGGVLDLLEDCKQRMGITTPLSLVVTDRTPTPALFGFIRPRLLLPPGILETLSREELRHVFLHELAHLKRRDVLVGWLASVLQVVQWWNPLVWLAQNRMRADREVACDALALSALEPGDSPQYGRTIIRLLEQFSRPQLLPAVTGILENRSQLKRRVTMIAHFDRRTGHFSLLSAALFVAVGFMALTDAPDAAGQEPSKRARPAAVPAAAAPVATAPADDARTGKPELPEGSRINEKGIIEDRIDWPFVNDPEVIGKWESVDFVKTIDQFNSKKPRTKAKDLFLLGVVFNENGKASWPWKGWTKGLLLHDGDKTASAYTIKEIDGSTYMFLQWKSGDYTIRHRKPLYYVLKKLPADSKKFESASEFFKMEPGEKAVLDSDSHIGANGRIVDNVDRPFVNDPQLIGKWESVDFVDRKAQFKPGKPNWKGDLFLKELTFLPDGKTPKRWLIWTKGVIMHIGGDKTASKYDIQQIDGKTYMFFEWKSGDYIFAHRKPAYYVLRKVEAGSTTVPAGEK